MSHYIPSCQASANAPPNLQDCCEIIQSMLSEYIKDKAWDKERNSVNIRILKLLN